MCVSDTRLGHLWTSPSAAIIMPSDVLTMLTGICVRVFANRVEPFLIMHSLHVMATRSDGYLDARSWSRTLYFSATIYLGRPDSSEIRRGFSHSLLTLPEDTTPGITLWTADLPLITSSWPWLSHNDAASSLSFRRLLFTLRCRSTQ